MAELTELEGVVRALRPFIEGRAILRCRVIQSIVVYRRRRQGRKRAAARPEKTLRDERIRGLERRGKYLIIALEHGAVVLHFRFDGKLICFDSRKTPGHVHAAFETREGTLANVDPRRLGRGQWVASPGKIVGITRRTWSAVRRTPTAAFQEIAGREPEAGEYVSVGSEQHRRSRKHLIDRGSVACKD